MSMILKFQQFQQQKQNINKKKIAISKRQQQKEGKNRRSKNHISFRILGIVHKKYREKEIEGFLFLPHLSKKCDTILLKIGKIFGSTFFMGMESTCDSYEIM